MDIKWQPISQYDIKYGKVLLLAFDGRLIYDTPSHIKSEPSMFSTDKEFDYYVGYIDDISVKISHFIPTNELIILSKY